MIRGLRQVATAAAVAVAAVPLAAGGAAVAPALGPLAATSCAEAATLDHAALVVEHGDGSVIRVCVAFSGASITGEQLLAASGVEYATSSYGSTGDAVCQVDHEPAQYPPGCWTASSPYWALFVSRGGGSWTSSSLGVSQQTFAAGDAEGFRYEGQGDNSAPPSPSGTCPAPTAPPAPPSAHATARPPASARPALATTPAATATPPPAAMPPIASTSASTMASASPTTGPPVAAVTAAPRPPGTGSPLTLGIAAGIGAILIGLVPATALRRRRRDRPHPATP